MHTKEQVRALLRRLEGEPADNLESEELEFKRWEQDPKSLHKLLRETVVCLANTRGGTIVLGVRDGVRSRREAIEGIGSYDTAGLRKAVYDGTDPHILVEIEELREQEGTLLLVHVPKGMPPHTTSDGVARIRIGKECKPLTGRTFAHLLASGGQRDLTAEVVPEAKDTDLDRTELVHLRRLIQRGAQDQELLRLDDLRLLEALGLTINGRITVAAILVLGTDQSLRRFLAQHEVSFIRYRSRTQYDQRRDLRGPILSVLREMEQLISANNRVRTIQEDGFGQLEFPDLSWDVAREAVLNAVTHRDYFLRQSVQVSLYSDRLEVMSPGGFMDDITPENVLRHPPVHRNELLARVFQTVGLVNRVGLGVDRIYEGLLRLGKDIPRYTADESHVNLVLPLRTNEPFALFLSQETRQGRELDLDDLLVLRILLRRTTVDRWSVSAFLQVPEREAAEQLIALREKGYLVARGRGRGVSYDLRRDLADRLRGRAHVDAYLDLDEEAVRIHMLQLLKKRGRLTNAEIRRLSGFSRTQVYRLIKQLEQSGQVRIVGKGRGAHIVPA